MDIVLFGFIYWFSCPVRFISVFQVTPIVAYRVSIICNFLFLSYRLDFRVVKVQDVDCTTEGVEDITVSIFMFKYIFHPIILK